MIESRKSTWGPAGMWLGEVLVHAQDIRRPLGLTTQPSVAAATEVARCYSGRDFTVSGRTISQGLSLRADDGPFSAGDGPLVSGPTVALVMVMAGRAAHLDDLTGPGLTELSSRVRAATASPHPPAPA